MSRLNLILTLSGINIALLHNKILIELRLGDNNNSIEVKDNPMSTNKFKLNSVKFDDIKWHVMQVGDIIQFGLSKIKLISVETGRRVTAV